MLETLFTFVVLPRHYEEGLEGLVGSAARRGIVEAGPEAERERMLNLHRCIAICQGGIPQITVTVSLASNRLPSSSIQVKVSVPDCCGRNLKAK
jgi:hypothetical protein